MISTFTSLSHFYPQYILETVALDGLLDDDDDGFFAVATLQAMQEVPPDNKNDKQTEGEANDGATTSVA